MRVKKIGIVITVNLLFIGLAGAQTFYKCGNTYSQTSCAPDAKTLRVGPDTTNKRSDAILSTALAEAKRLPPPPPDFVQLKLQECERRIRSSMKDPDAAKISDGSRLGPSLQYSSGLGTYNGTSYSFKVNGKNSYGGYTGNKMWTCVFDLTEAKLISVSEAGPYPD